MPDSTMFEHALYYSSLGWAIFPLKPGEKVPLTTHGVKDATTDPEQIKAWWAKHPNANIGLALGSVSGGLYCADIDVDKEKGIDGWDSLDEFDQLPDTIRQDTPRGGAHFIFHSDKPVRNKNNFRPGIDIRGNGYYIVLAPSIHPNGKAYTWLNGCAPGEIELAEFPADLRPPEPRRVMPWEHPAPTAPKPSASPHKTPVIERASLYLHEIPGAVQGSGGHDALLWAARAMVDGFDLSDSDALALLWGEFNPRCSPPWDRGNPTDVKDFERKVAEVRKTPGEKPVGWLLDECGLRSDSDALLAMGKRLADELMAGHAKKTTRVIAAEVAKTFDEGEDLVVSEFPLDCFPSPLYEYAKLVQSSHCVDASFVGLPMLVVGAAAIGNVALLKVKEGFLTPSVLWALIIAASGSNKSGPIRAVTRALSRTPTIADIEEPMVNPQHKLIIDNATIESIIGKLAVSPRGLLSKKDEAASWTGSFDAYRKGGGGSDEQTWIKLWDADEYHLDRKTDNECLCITAASVSVLGGIQPKMLAKCFDPDKFSSGLVPRLLVAYPPDRDIFFTEAEVTVEAEADWFAAVKFLRTRPFAAIDTSNGKFMPHIITLSPTAKDRFVNYYNQISHSIRNLDETGRMFASKARVMAPRIALVLYGMHCSVGKHKWLQPLPLPIMEDAIKLSKWFLDEQLRVYGLAGGKYQDRIENETIDYINKTCNGTVSVRKFQRSHNKRFADADAVRAVFDRLVAKGMGTWDGHSKMVFASKEVK